MNWFTSYLKNRSQCVNYINIESHLLPITSGVPHGSLLEPIIFLILISDLIHSSKLLKFIMYADDTTLLLSTDNFDTLFNHINQELILVAAWFYMITD